MFTDTGRRGGKEERFHEGKNGGSGVEEGQAREDDQSRQPRLG